MTERSEVVDFVIESSDPRNLTLQQVQRWWEDQQKNNYFVDKYYNFYQPELITELNLTKESYLLKGDF